MLTLERISAATAATGTRQSAGVECCLALWSARAPEQEPLVRVARKLQGAMPAREQELMRALDDKLPEWPLLAANAFYGLDCDDLEGGLESLRAAPPRDVAAACLAPALPAARARVRPLVTKPEDTVCDLLRVITAFARAGFARHWADQRERLAPVAATLERRLSEDAGRGLLSASPRAVAHPERDSLSFLGSDDTLRVDCGALERLDVLPSFWLRRRIVATHSRGRLGLCIGIGSALQGEIDAERTTMLMATLGDRRRFEIFRLCLERGRTTTELASTLEITEGPVSRHLRELERGGLVVGRRDGRYVVYTAVVEVLQLLGRHLLVLPQQAGEQLSAAA